MHVEVLVHVHLMCWTSEVYGSTVLEWVAPPARHSSCESIWRVVAAQSLLHCGVPISCAGSTKDCCRERQEPLHGTPGYIEYYRI